MCEWLKNLRRRISEVYANVRGNRKTIDFKDFTERFFDDSRTELAANFDTIKIDARCPVKILSSNSMDVEVHFYGDAYFKGNVKFNVTQEGNELNITVKLDGVFKNLGLQLDISIPKGKKFKKISVTTTNDDIKFFDESISAEKLRVFTSTGESIVRGNFDDIEIKSSIGDMDIYSKCVNNSRIETSSGDVNIRGDFKNLEIESSLGDITLDATYVESLRVKTSLGEANINGCFKDIYINSTLGDITLDTTSVESLKVETSLGDADITGDFKEVYIKTTGGEITANICAKSDVQIFIETTSADAELIFENVRKVNTTATTSSGMIFNHLPEKTDGNIANIRYKTTSGDLTIN